MVTQGAWSQWVRIAGACLLALGCAVEPHAGSEDTAAVREPIAASCITDTNIIYEAGPAKKLKPLATHFCWMTMASGNLDGAQPDWWYDTGLGVEVQTDGEGVANWWVVNRAFSGGGVAQARCVARSCFTGDGVNDQVWISTHNISAIATANGSCATNTNHTAWWGDAATVLRWWPGPGKTNGSGENTQVVQSGNAFSASAIHAADCYHDGLGRFITGRAVSLFVGTPNSGQLALFTGSDFFVQGNYTLPLGVYSDEAVCFFTRIFGKFAGAGESVRLYQVASGGRYQWYAKSTQGGSGSGVKGQGKCFWYNQWNK